MKVKLNCAFCNAPIERFASQIKKRNFCSKRCLASFSSKEGNPLGYMTLKDYSGVSRHMAELNRTLNPKRMTAETREKLRQARLGCGEGKTYTKTYSRHTHRVVAEEMLGRPLRPGEVVHHIDGDRRNNNPSNLKVFVSQKLHAEYHQALDRFFREGVIQ